jgi:hypothetical protein
MTVPKVQHWIATKRALICVKGTLDFGILCSISKDPKLCWYTYSNWAGSVDERKSISGYVFILGMGAVTWTSEKQHPIALSSTEAEY